MDIEVGVRYTTGEADIFTRSTKNVEERFTLVQIVVDASLPEIAQLFRVEGLFDTKAGIWYPPQTIQFIREA